MIKGKVFIDGVDVKSMYGAYIVEGGYDDVPCFPSMKTPEINEWFESSEVEVDLSSPCVESHDINLRFVLKGGIDNVKDFVDFLMSSRVHTFDMVDIARSRTLRVVSISTSGYSPLFSISVSVADDDPRAGIYSGEPFYSIKQTGFKIDGNDIDTYGAILNGSLAWLIPDKKMKENELVESSYIDGEVHSNNSGAFTERDDVSIGFVVRSNSIEDFWKMRDLMLSHLVKEGERTISYNGAEFRAYYKNCRSVRFDYSRRCWWEFELVFGYIGE